ncbi:MAG: hypothetical protein OSJ54_06040 [Oscillospiraceae bacterium]|nr:hypothetical protein [Oscillospiraceae bacterium]
MLEVLFNSCDDTRVEPASVDKFYEKYIGQDEDMGDDFYGVIRDASLAAYREGIAAALKLLTECGVRA